jgi:hypothetical protein
MQNIDWGSVIQTVITVLGALAGIIGSHKSLAKKIDQLKK